MEPLERVAILLALMRELEGVMQQEGQVLRTMRLDRLEALQAEKATLAEAYEIELRAFRKDPAAAAGLPAEARRTLEDASRTFQQAIRANVRAIQAGRQVVEGIVRRLGASLAAGRSERAGYRADAPPADPPGGRVIAVAFDRRI
ncbi:MAG: hypothetical protein U1E14_09285 [Geminicoccaceae bacterium]